MAVSNMRQRLLDLISALPIELGGVWHGGARLMSPMVENGRLALRLGFGAHAFTLAHSMEPELDALLIVESRFGKVPRVLAAECYGRLLDVNFMSAEKRMSAFALDRETGDVVLTNQCDLARLELAALMALLEANAALAQQWRRDFFLNTTESAMPFAGRDAFAMHI